MPLLLFFLSSLKQSLMSVLLFRFGWPRRIGIWLGPQASLLHWLLCPECAVHGHGWDEPLNYRPWIPSESHHCRPLLWVKQLTYQDIYIDVMYWLCCDHQSISMSSSTPFYSPLCPVTCTGLTGATQLRLRGPHWVEISAPKSSTAVLQHPMACLWIMKKGCSTGLMPQRMFFNIYYIATNHVLLTFFDNSSLPSQKKDWALHS